MNKLKLLLRLAEFVEVGLEYDDESLGTDGAM
jgi:hypothetical protein